MALVGVVNGLKLIICNITFNFDLNLCRTNSGAWIALGVNRATRYILANVQGAAHGVATNEPLVLPLSNSATCYISTLRIYSIICMF